MYPGCSTDSCVPLNNYRTFETERLWDHGYAKGLGLSPGVHASCRVPPLRVLEHEKQPGRPISHDGLFAQEKR